MIRYVTKPLELARARANGDVPGALDLLSHVLSIDPKNVEALALRADLTKRGNRSDAGP